MGRRTRQRRAAAGAGGGDDEEDAAALLAALSDKPRALRAEPLGRLPAELVGVARNFLSARECAAVVAWGEGGAGFERSQQRERRGYAFRDNGRRAVHAPAVAAALFARAAPLLPPQLRGGRRPVGCNPNVRLYRYERGQRFGQHIDEAVPGPAGAESEYTLLMYLNDDGVEGGETVFHPEDGGAPVAFAPERGAALFHGHGDRCLLHEGAEVRQGAKYLLRTDVYYG